jgi:hypothetical protein
MNGRLYDPVLSVFISPDNFVQEPANSLNFNRYSYCLNNPLIYTDPSGDIIFTILAAIFCPPLIPAAMQVDMAWIGGGFNSMANGGTFWDGAWRGGVTGLINAGFSFLNVPGMIPNGFLHAGTNILGNGISNALFDKPFFDNWGYSAGSGFAGGAYSGYQLSKEGELNYWWGNEVGGGRNQWSFVNSPTLEYRLDEFMNNNYHRMNLSCFTETLILKSAQIKTLKILMQAMTPDLIFIFIDVI